MEDSEEEVREVEAPGEEEAQPIKSKEFQRLSNFLASEIISSMEFSKTWESSTSIKLILFRAVHIILTCTNWYYFISSGMYYGNW